MLKSMINPDLSRKKIVIILLISIALTTVLLAEEPKEGVDKKKLVKYSSGNSNIAIEVEEIIEIYKETINSIINMNVKTKNYNDRLHNYIESLEDYEIYRFLYLDSFINSQYPEFYKEFIFINSDMKRAVSSGLFTEDDIFNLSIYPHENIEPYFTDNVRSSNTLPTLHKVRNGLWKRMIEEDSEFSILYESFTFNDWAIINFISTEEVYLEDRPTSVIYAECVIIDSPNLKMIGEMLRLHIVMFGEDRDFFVDQNYLVNYGYSISPRSEKRVIQPTIITYPQMKYVSQNNRIYSLAENNEIKIYDSKSMYNSKYNPLEGTGITNAGSLFEKIMELQNILKERGER